MVSSSHHSILTEHTSCSPWIWTLSSRWTLSMTKPMADPRNETLESNHTIWHHFAIWRGAWSSSKCGGNYKWLCEIRDLVTKSQRIFRLRSLLTAMISRMNITTHHITSLIMGVYIAMKSHGCPKKCLIVQAKSLRFQLWKTKAQCHNYQSKSSLGAPQCDRTPLSMSSVLFFQSAIMLGW